MRKNNSNIHQSEIDVLSNFIIEEFLTYYPFNEVKFLATTVADYKLNSYNFHLEINMLASQNKVKEQFIEDTLWLATIRQRLAFKMVQIGLAKDLFKEVKLTIKSIYKQYDKYIECTVSFVDTSNNKFSGNKEQRSIQRSRIHKSNSDSWLDKARALFK